MMDDQADIRFPRLLMVMAGAAHGGAELFFERLTMALARHGLPVVALIRHNKERKRLLETAGVAVEEAKFRGGIRRFLDRDTPGKFEDIVDTFQPDIVLSFMSRAAKAVPAGRGKFLHVGRLGGYYDLKYFQSCDHLIGNTQDLKQYLLAQGWDKNRSWYLPNFVREDKGGKLSRAALGLQDQDQVILAFGRLHENKGFDVLIEAMHKMERPVLLLAGTGPLENDLKEQAESLGGRVQFLGWRDDIPDLLAICDVFCCPSRHEPLGNVVLEGWMQQKPVVAAAVQGPSELITEGADGILVPPENSEALATGILQMLENPEAARRMAEAGHERYMQSFCEQAVMQQYLAFFEKILTQGRA